LANPHRAGNRRPIKQPEATRPLFPGLAPCLGFFTLILIILSAALLPPGPAWSQTLRPPLPPPPASPALVVCLDPGHPSEVSSGKGVTNGVTELDMNWQVSEKLAALLAQIPGLKVVKTRQVRDQLTTNRERAEIANRAGAALLLRLHCDAGKGSGYTLYYPDQQGKKKGFVGPSPQVIAASRKAAQAVHAGMAKTLAGALKDNGIRGDSSTYIGRKQGALTGSIFSQVPVVTVEMVFLDNKADAAFIKSPQGQQRLAQALAEGVKLYLNTLSKAAGWSK
jgi:N-acetylmuramoyl-L-alanine amidase